MTADVSAIVVSYADPIAAAATARTLLEQSAPPLELLVVDNGAELHGSDVAWPEGVRVLAPEGNVGYVRACNRAAAEARGRWLLFLNPDAPADPDCLARLRAAAEEEPDVAVVGAQVLLPGGERVNAGENPVHLTGLCWSGRFEQPREQGPPRDVLAVSGAALMIRADVFAALGGFEPGYFMYHDDVDVCWRARLAGWRVRFVPEATVVHDYAFEKGTGKWFWLERNRAWTVLSNYGAGTLLLLAPLLLATELAVLALALRGGWAREKLRAWWALARGLPALLRWRRRVQALRRVSDAELVALMTARFDTPLLDAPAARRAGPLLDAYRAAVLSALRRAARAR
ncbi:MAG: glycosyltransferase family 2 protein [Actinobacteria bacterium]|nr:glycosyltransferase family 2 protein [Actinomycetota bacterium]